jgi:hypothetical protein
MRYGQLTFKFKRSSLRPASLTMVETSHMYALLSTQPVTSSLPSVENDVHFTLCSCRRGELMGWPVSRFHNCAVWSQDALARIRPFGEIAMPMTPLVCPVKTICCQVVVFHVLIERSSDPEISIFPSALQARQFTGSSPKVPSSEMAS